MPRAPRTVVLRDGQIYDLVPASQLPDGDKLDSREEQSRDQGAPA